MAITNSGMTLYTDNDTQQSWTGTNDLDDYNTSIQGTNSESWNVDKNVTETGSLSLSADLTGAKYFTCWMKSDLANYYTSITMELESTTNNYLSYTVADSTNRDVSGDFHCSVLQLSEGTPTGTYVPASHSTFRVIVDNSSSGNIRAVINNWIDAMYYGTGRIIGGTSDSDALFYESDTTDKTNDIYDGCTEVIGGVVFSQTDITVNTSSGYSIGETLVFRYARNTDNVYNLLITGTAVFQNTSIAASNSLLVFDSTAASAFSMSGGSISSASLINLGSSQSISGVVFTSCGSIVTNTATFQNCTINNTIETTTGSLEIQTASDLVLMSNISFNGYSENSRYAVYIPATVTGSITLPSFVFDNPTSTFCIYWAGTSGTLTVNRGGTTNLATTAWSSAGGTVYIPAITKTTGTTVVNNISMEENPFTSDVQASDFGVETNLIEFNSVETAPDFYDNIIEETFSVDTEVYKFEIQD